MSQIDRRQAIEDLRGRVQRNNWWVYQNTQLMIRHPWQLFSNRRLRRECRERLRENDDLNHDIGRLRLEQIEQDG